jgi:AbrB family looped-hinge helix DNA binding protein
MDKTVEVTRRGQITIPKNMCDHLGIDEGKKYRMHALKGGILVLTPHQGEAINALSEMRQVLLDRGASLSEMLEELRRMREKNGDSAMPATARIPRPHGAS